AALVPAAPTPTTSRSLALFFLRRGICSSATLTLFGASSKQFSNSSLLILSHVLNPVPCQSGARSRLHAMPTGRSPTCLSPMHAWLLRPQEHQQQFGVTYLSLRLQDRRGLPRSYEKQSLSAGANRPQSAFSARTGQQRKVQNLS